MSAYVEGTVEFSDEECLLAALTQIKEHTGLGWSKDQIEVHQNGSNLIGYHGDVRDQVAHIIIRRNNVGFASNDIGFVKQGNSYVPLISEFDSRRYNDKFVQKLKQLYGVEKTVKQARKKGYKTEVVKEGEKFRVVCRKR